MKKNVVSLISIFLILLGAASPVIAATTGGGLGPRPEDNTGGGSGNGNNGMIDGVGGGSGVGNNGAPGGGVSLSVDETLKTLESAIGLKIGNATGENITIGAVLTALLPYLYTFGGMILFAMIIWGGFEMLAGAQETKAQEAGKQRITAAAIGFVLLFVSYWLAQLLEVILNINILGKK
jgi:hypothetical protein